MSAFAVRKNNIGRALVRFLIGAIVIAALVIVINEFWLKKEIKPANDVIAENTGYNSADDPQPLGGNNGQDEGIGGIYGSEDSDGGVNPDGNTPDDTWDDSDNNDDGWDDFDPDDGNPDDENGPENDTDDNPDDGYTGDDGFDDPWQDDGSEVTPIVTGSPEPVNPIPGPAATPVPAELLAKPVTDDKAVVGEKVKWYMDKKDRVNNGLVEFSVSPKENPHIIKLVGWSFSTHTMTKGRGWDGDSNKTYIVVKGKNQKNPVFYEATIEPGITGTTHTDKNAKNLDKADFICYIDVSGFADDEYTFSTANLFTIKHNGTHTFKHGYTLGHNYDITVKGGIITNSEGLKNN